MTTYTQQEINNYYSKYSCCFASLANDYINSLAIGAFDCGQKLNKLLQFKSYLDILKCYKVDTCIINQPQVGTFGPQIDLPKGVDSNTVYSFYKNEILISDNYTIEDIINYFISLGFGSITQVPFFQPDLYLPLVGWEDGDYNYSTQVLYTINPSLFYPLSNTTTGTINPPNYTGELLYATYGDIPDVYDIVWKSSDVSPTITWGQLLLKEQNCEQYTEEELNCISNEDLDKILFWLKQICLTVKNKPTISEIECTNSEDEYTFEVNQTIIIQAGDSIEVERNGNTYIISNPLPDQEVIITAGSNITVTGTYPNFTISATGGAGGVVNLGYTASPTSGIITNDSGSDATIPLSTGTNAGLQSPAQFTKLGNITITQAVNLDTIKSDTVTNNAKVSNANHSGDATGSTVLTLATVNSNVGSFTNANITVDAKGRITAASNGSGSGTGDVVGPSSSTNNNIVLFDDTTGKLIKDSGVTLATKVDANSAITGATKTKITYDAKGLVTSSADATTADITDSSDKRYVTDADLIVIGNTSGTNTGDNATNTTSNSYADGKVADAINDGTTTIAPSQNAVFDALALKASKTFVESISLQDGGTSIAATTYTIELYANYAYTINELKIISNAGTCTANLKIGATSVTGISAVSVSSTIATATATAANTVAIGDKITLVTTSNSGLNNLQLTIKTTRI